MGHGHTWWSQEYAVRSDSLCIQIDSSQGRSVGLCHTQFFVHFVIEIEPQIPINLLRGAGIKYAFTFNIANDGPKRFHVQTSMIILLVGKWICVSSKRGRPNFAVRVVVFVALCIANSMTLLANLFNK